MTARASLLLMSNQQGVHAFAYGDHVVAIIIKLEA
jgi:hypothetical protein